MKNVPKAILNRVKELDLKANHHALLLLLDNDTAFLEFRTNSSNAFLDTLIRWRRVELPALYNSNVRFFIVSGNPGAKPNVLIKEEKFPLYKKRIL